MTQFFVKGIPTKRRPRFTRQGGVYTDAKTSAEEEAIAARYQGPRHRCPMSVRVDVYPKLPKRAAKGAESVPVMKKPDLDNVLKVVMDALQGVAYDNDKQVVRAEAVRHDAQRIEWDYIVVTVSPVRRKDA